MERLGAFYVEILLQLVLKLKPLNLPKRHRFAVWALENSQEDPSFLSQIFFSNGAYFRLIGYVNNQNCRLWLKEQPEEIQDLSLGLWADGFKNPPGENVTVNGDLYSDITTDYLMPKIEARDHGDIRFHKTAPFPAHRINQWIN